MPTSEETNTLKVSPVSTFTTSKGINSSVSSLILMSSIFATLGASFTGSIVMVNSVVSVSSPSDTIAVILDSPYQSAAGDAVIVLSVESAVTTRESLSEYTKIEKTSPVSMSVISNANVSGSSSRIVRSSC